MPLTLTFNLLEVIVVFLSITYVAYTSASPPLEAINLPVCCLLPLSTLTASVELTHVKLGSTL